MLAGERCLIGYARDGPSSSLVPCAASVQAQKRLLPLFSVITGEVRAPADGVPATVPAVAFTRSQLDAADGKVVPDLVEPGVRLLFVAINPGLWCAAAGVPFAHPGNRFWTALLAGGLIEHPIRVSDGISAADRAYLTGRGLGITSLFPRANRHPTQLSTPELRACRQRLTDTVEELAPRVVTICGTAEYAHAFGHKAMVTTGRQDQQLAGAELWLTPNPSVANREANISMLGALFRAAARAAGVLPA